MTELHRATATPLTRDLVADMRAEFTQWLDLWAPAAGHGSYPAEHRGLALSILEEMDDHLQIRFAVTLASHGVEATP